MEGLIRPVPDPTGPDQESVWSYPRPPLAEVVQSHLCIEHGGRTVAETRSPVRVLETSHPPTFYVPRADIGPGLLRRSAGRSVCEWNGEAVYWDVMLGDLVLGAVGWSYPSPSPDFEVLRDHVAFYPAPFDRCTLDGEVVTPQPGGFYGGWITSRVAGPFKGVPGSGWW